MTASVLHVAALPFPSSQGTQAALLAIVDGQATFADGIAAGSIEVTGNASAVDRIFTNLDTFLTNFPIVEP